MEQLNSHDCEMIEISSLIKDPNNMRDHDRKNIDAIKGSFTRWGQVHPIVINNDNMILAGHGRLQAAIEMKWTKIKAIRQDLKGSEATAFSLADNRTSELGEWNKDLNKTLAALQKDGFNLEAIGFNDNDWEQPNDLEPNKPEEEVHGEIQFSKFIGESNNYIVLLFNHEIDWLQAETHFNISSKANTFQDGKVQSIGTGRIVDGAEYLRRMTNV
jgi:hypothetical protein